MIGRNWLNGIDGIIPGGINTKDFAVVARVDQPTARRMLLELARNGIGVLDGDVVEFSEGDKVKAALFAVERGILIDDAAEHLSWKDFEGMTAQILEIKDFATVRNYVMTKPRMEIDVVGLKFGVAILIDCKHWQRHSPSALRTAAQKQVERTKHYVARTEGAVAAPVIVTIYQDKMSFVDKVPIVPIFQFSSFIDEFYGNLDEVRTITGESQ